MTSAYVDVLVVGAGLAGASAARSLADAGRRVAVLDKGRGPGGRLSTRRSGGGTFDHGAVVLQARGDAFKAWLDSESRAGRAARWRDGWVGVPGMNALVAGLLEGVDVRWSTTASALRRSDGTWRAVGVEGETLAEAPMAVLAIPAPQACTLLTAAGAEGAGPKADGAAQALDWLVDALANLRYAPCWSALIVVDGGFSPDRDGAAPIDRRSIGGDIEAIIREVDKPGRPDAGHVVVQASAGWSKANLERPADEVAALLREAFVRATGTTEAHVRSSVAHRWRYARPLDLIDAGIARSVPGLVLAGDFVGEATAAGDADAERAWCSGRAAAGHLLGASFQPKS